MLTYYRLRAADARAGRGIQNYYVWVEIFHEPNFRETFLFSTETAPPERNDHSTGASPLQW